MTAELNTNRDTDKVFKIKPASSEKHLQCRNCKSNLSRIKRGSLVKGLLFWLPIKRFVCYRCSRKTYRFNIQ